MKTDQCLLCNSTSLKPSHQIKYLDKIYFYDFCLDCQFTFQNPWPSIEIEQIYNDPKYWNSKDVYNDDKYSEKKHANSYSAYQNDRTKEAKKRYNVLEKYFSSHGGGVSFGNWMCKWDFFK